MNSLWDKFENWAVRSNRNYYIAVTLLWTSFGMVVVSMTLLTGFLLYELGFTQ